MADYDYTSRARACEVRLAPLYPARAMWHSVLTAGHCQTLPGWGLARVTAEGFVLLYIRRGRGWVKVQNRRIEVGPGEMIFLNCHRGYELGTDPVWPMAIQWVHFDSGVGHLWTEALACHIHPVLRPQPGVRILKQLQRIERMARSKPDGCEEQLSSIVHQIVADLFTQRARRLRLAAPSEAPYQGAPGQDLPLSVKKVLERITTTSASALTISKLAGYGGSSRSHLFALFKKHVGMTPIAFLIHHRLDRAKDMLQHTNLPIKEIAIEVGINDSNYFSVLFRRKTGKTPKQYRREYGSFVCAGRSRPPLVDQRNHSRR